MRDVRVGGQRRAELAARSAGSRARLTSGTRPARQHEAEQRPAPGPASGARGAGGARRRSGAWPRRARRRPSASPRSTLRIARLAGSHDGAHRAATTGIGIAACGLRARRRGQQRVRRAGTSTSARGARRAGRPSRGSARPRRSRGAARARAPRAARRPAGESITDSTVSNGRIGWPVARSLGQRHDAVVRSCSPSSAASHGPLIAKAAWPERKRFVTSAPSASSGTAPRFDQPARASRAPLGGSGRRRRSDRRRRAARRRTPRGAAVASRRPAPRRRADRRPRASVRVELGDALEIGRDLARRARC